MRSLAEDAARAVDIDYAGVDLLRDRNGSWLVGEVNGIPAWKGLQDASGIDVSQLLCDAFVRKIHLSERTAACG
jgi:glutathione synthase/RimK-type ligase-like ATP-grasp enzyme